MDCDLVVIGSGFGGSVAALRAARAGLRVLVLERGARLDDAGFDELVRGRRPWLKRGRNGGLLELHRLGRLVSLTGSAVGGGSHLYTGVTMPAPPEVFESNWPDGLDADVLAEHYRRVEDLIGPTPVPGDASRVAALEMLAPRLGAEAIRLPVAMEWVDNPTRNSNGRGPAGVRTDLVRWLRGCGAKKRTLDTTILREAESAGAEIRSRHEVRSIEPSGDGYRVWFRGRVDGRCEHTSMVSRRVVIAAGTINTVRLLLKCRDRYRTLPALSRRLGHRFFTNGDHGAALLGPRLPLGGDDGPPVTGWLDLWKTDRLFLMETGLPPVWPTSFNGPLSWVCRLRDRRRANSNRAASPCVWTFGAMGFDDSPATLRLDARGRMTWRADGEPDRSFARRRHDRLADLARAAGATLLAPPTLVEKQFAVTIHPLGGAGLADSPERGVTNPFGEVFGYRGLYVADGALLPTPTGVPPSMTIAALADRAASHLVDSC